MDWVKWGLVGALVGTILLPFVVVGLVAYGLYRLISKLRELLTMPAECSSLNSITGLCDWGEDCLCFEMHQRMHDAQNGSTQLSFSQLTPPAKPKSQADDGAASYGFWPEYRNPGLVAEGTQPVEAEEPEPFPGFSDKGG